MRRGGAPGIPSTEKMPTLIGRERDTINSAGQPLYNTLSFGIVFSTLQARTGKNENLTALACIGCDYSRPTRNVWQALERLPSSIRIRVFARYCQNGQYSFERVIRIMAGMRSTRAERRSLALIILLSILTRPGGTHRVTRI